MDQFADMHMDVLAYSRTIEGAAAKSIQELAKAIQKELAIVNLAALTRGELQSLLDVLNKLIDDGYGSIAATVLAVSDDLADVVASKAAQATGKNKPSKVTRAGDVLVEGLTISEAWKVRSHGLARAVTKAVRLAAASDQAQPEGLFGKDGAFAASERTARTTVQQMSVATETQAVIDSTRGNKSLKGFRSSSMFDSATCLTCAAMDGQLFDGDGIAVDPALRGVGKPSYHLNCRCVLIPELADDDAKAGPDGSVSRGIDFERWIEGKSDAYKRRYFGPGRYELWRKGELTLTDLINGSGAQITLSELQLQLNV